MRNQYRHRERKRTCQFCTEPTRHVIDYKNVGLLERFVDEQGRIRKSGKTGACRRHQLMADSMSVMGSPAMRSVVQSHRATHLAQRLACHGTGTLRADLDDPVDLLRIGQQLVHRRRQIVGFDHDFLSGEPTSWPGRTLPRLISCPWCLGLYVTPGVWAVWEYIDPVVVVVVAATSVLVAMEKWAHG